ncbi:MAG: CDP-diacylglycerol--glycerol-3-phosphate 3-phosphatidyltransferase [Rhodospirillales bacterium]|nr:CDP-diacylglycerol--glycerol-3-phosphate 3-phosphatidyltransferase [Rhodospirillales bacterium]
MLKRLPNLLTFSRIAAIPVVGGLLLLDSYNADALALAAYVLACITDYLDGYLARAWSLQSRMGRFLDPVADKLLVVTVLLMLVGVDRIAGLDIAAAAIILCRELLISGLREFLADVKIQVPVTRLAKWKTGIQMVAIGFLVAGVAGPTFGTVTSVDIGLVGLWIAAALTVFTGYDYVRAGLAHIAGSDDGAP